MICKNCNIEIKDEQSKFCPDCGSKVILELIDITCQSCSATNASTSKFCSKCGSTLGTENKTEAENSISGQEIDMDDFLESLNSIYYEKIMNRIDTFNKTENTHEMVNPLSQKKIEVEYSDTLNKVYSYIVDFYKKNIENIKPNDLKNIEKKLKALIDESKNEISNKLKSLESERKLVVENTSATTTEFFLKNIAAGASAGALSGTILPGVGNILGTIIGGIAGYVAGDKLSTKEQEYLENYDVAFNSFLESIDTIYGNFCSLLDEFAEMLGVIYLLTEDDDEEEDTNSCNHIFNNRNICTKCGCSKGFLESLDNE
ncbi:MAG: zinc ribbon domain-containing protein [Leptospiraceae bacterium]|nr:zinc ribbon domain-containing protein [Leptospiraceae bacterium]